MNKKPINDSNAGGGRFANLRIPRGLIWGVVIIVAVLILSASLRPIWYFEVIENDEIGIAIEAGQVINVKQPGIAYDIGLFVRLVKSRPALWHWL